MKISFDNRTILQRSGFVLFITLHQLVADNIKKSCRSILAHFKRCRSNKILRHKYSSKIKKLHLHKSEFEVSDRSPKRADVFLFSSAFFKPVTCDRVRQNYSENTKNKLENFVQINRTVEKKLWAKTQDKRASANIKEFAEKNLAEQHKKN